MADIRAETFFNPAEGKMERSNKHSMWCIYILRCRNNYLYIGMTNNLPKRLTAHDRGKGSKFVFSRRPFELMKVIYCRDERSARRFESGLKKLRRSDKFTALDMPWLPVTSGTAPKGTRQS